MASVLILQPYRPDTPPALLQRGGALLDALMAATPDHQVTVLRGPAAPPADVGPERYAPHAAVRNAWLAHLQPQHTHVLWVDADLTAYPADLLTTLLARCPDGIAAPVILHERTGRFYDLGGFVDQAGQCARPERPWFDQPGPVYHLASVGCCYLAPAIVYRAWGLRYAPTGPRYGVEHWSVCSGAAARGMPVRAYADLIATHAWLPDYGLPHS